MIAAPRHSNTICILQRVWWGVTINIDSGRHWTSTGERRYFKRLLLEYNYNYGSHKFAVYYDITLMIISQLAVLINRKIL